MCGAHGYHFFKDQMDIFKKGEDVFKGIVWVV